MFVMTVSQAEAAHQSHVKLWFRQAKRLVEELAPRIHRLKRYKLKVKVFLDYMWLQQNYYESNYGEDWLCGADLQTQTPTEAMGKCLPILQAGAAEIWLPNDSGGELEKMIKAWTTLSNRLLVVEEKEFDEHELWTATAAVNESLRQQSRDPRDNENARRYLRKGNPFYRVTLRA